LSATKTGGCENGFGFLCEVARIVLINAQDFGEHSRECRFRILNHGVCAPADVLVRTDQDDAVLLYFALAEPISVEVLDLPAFTDHHGLELDAQAIGNSDRGVCPGFTGDPGEDGETGALGNVVCRVLGLCVSEPGVWQPEARERGLLVMQQLVLCQGWPLTAVGHYSR
jgi:hypothetical protein